MIVSITPSGPIYEGSEIIITVTAEEGGKPLENAEVMIDEQSYKTNSSGQVSYTASKTGTIDVSVSLEGYTGEKPSLVVKPRIAEFVLSDFSLSPDEIIAGKEVTFSFTITNEGPVQGTTVIRLEDKDMIGSVSNTSVEITLDAGASETRSINFTPKKEGEHNLYLYKNDETVSLPDNVDDFYAEQRKFMSDIFSVTVIGAAIVFLLLLIAVLGYYFFYMRRDTGSVESLDDGNPLSNSIENIKDSVSGLFRKKEIK